MKDKKMFKEYITAISEIYDKIISSTSARIYWQVLEPFSDSQCQDAFDKAIQTCKFFPKPAELIELIPGEAVPIEDKATVIATEILAHLQKWGSSRHPDLKDDPISMHLMANRWPYKKWAANILESELKWWSKEFVEAYRAYNSSDVPFQIDAPEDVRKLTEGIG